MNLLLIEDDDIKASTILDFIVEDIKTEINVLRKRSWQSGLIEVLDNKQNYDFVLLDMSMPRYDPEIGDVNEEFETFAGWDLLREMKRKSIELPVCVVTSFDFFGKDDNLINYEDLDQILVDEFPTFYRGMIYFNSSIISWKSKLSNIMDGVIKKDAETDIDN